MFSHRNICLILESSKHKIEFEENSVHISYLPMPHVFEKVLFNLSIMSGFKVGVYSGNVLKLLEDIQILKPTFFASVPRLLNKIYDSLNNKVEALKFPMKNIIKSVLEKKAKNLEEKGELKNFFLDIFTKKFRAALGGRVKYIITAAAPIDLKVMNFLKIAFSCPFIEAYGQTEGTGLEFGTSIYDHRASGHVGGPVFNGLFKLVDVPELDYLSTDKDQNGNPTPRGEIWFKS